MDDPQDNRGPRILGWTCLVLGLVGIFAPGLLAFVLLVLGATLLLRHTQTVEDAIRYLRRRFPAMAEAFDRAEARFRGRPGGDTPASE